MDKLIKDIREAVAEYMQSEGCSCCQDVEKHSADKARLGKLLHVSKYKDRSGYDFNKYRKPAPKSPMRKK